MGRFFTRKRLSMALAVFGIVLMGVDLLLTRNFFTHIGELMIASMVCFILSIILDRGPRVRSQASAGTDSESG